MSDKIEITLEDAKKMVEKVKNLIWQHEMANDMYYSSIQHKEDEKNLKFWKDKVQELGGTNE